MRWFREVPVVGFNSAKYDANIMKMYLSGTFSKYYKPEKEEVTLIKTISMYVQIESFLVNSLNS